MWKLSSGHGENVLKTEGYRSDTEWKNALDTRDGVAKRFMPEKDNRLCPISTAIFRETTKIESKDFQISTAEVFV